MARSVSDNVNIFEPGKDILDRAVEGYEENVPLLGQIAAGFTPPGIAMDVAAAGKYGRDAFKEFKQGNIGSGFKNAGIAALSGIAAVPLFGEVARPFKAALKSIDSAPGPAGINTLKVDPIPTPAVMPTAGSPVFEGSLRKKGPGVEKDFKVKFNAHQEGVQSAEELFGKSLRLNPEFQTVLAKVSDDLGLDRALTRNTKIDPDTMQTAFQIKTMPRIIEKVDTKYKGDFTQITDSVRNRIFVNTPEEADAVAKRLSDMFPTVDSGTQLYKKFGLIDRKLNIQFTGSNGEKIIGEVGIITKPMHDASDKAHKIYEAYRAPLKGMPAGAANSSIVKEGLRLEKVMQDIFNPAQMQIDPRFLKDLVEVFNKGGQVVAGRSGRLVPITPNMFSNSVFSKRAPSEKKSLICNGVAISHSEDSGDIKKPNTVLSTSGVTTAGPFSQEKYNISFIEPIVHKSANNNNDIFVELDEEDL